MPLTATEIVRAQRKHQEATVPETASEDLDSEIQRLEAELQQDSSDSSSDSDDSDDTSGDDGTEKEESNILSSSRSKIERIPSLPVQQLPARRKRTLQLDQDQNSRDRKKKSKHQQDLERDILKKLKDYTPRSSRERVPFYCRCCQSQSSNLEEWGEHQTSEEHLTAVLVERRQSYCKLCRKQLTSVIQLQEHLKSRPHLELLRKRKQGGSSRGRGRGMSGSRRQWT